MSVDLIRDDFRSARWSMKWDDSRGKRCGIFRFLQSSQRERREAYLAKRSTDKTQQRQRQHLRALRQGVSLEDSFAKRPKGERATVCRSWRGKRGWLLMHEAWESEKQHINACTDVTFFYHIQEHGSDRWELAIANAAEAAKVYPAFDMNVLLRLSMVRYIRPDAGPSQGPVHGPVHGPVQRLPSFQIQLPTLCEADLWPKIVCPICCTHQTGLIAACRSGCHFSCLRCWGRWMHGKVEIMRARRHIEDFLCFGVGCTNTLDPRIVDELCLPANKLQLQLQRRIELQSNVLYPKAVQVDCPNPGCVGLGYLGHDTVMCFICEHQWPAVDGKNPQDISDWKVDHLKACPRCSEYIEKNGGCDHMTCRCGYEFWWTTLKPFRTT